MKKIEKIKKTLIFAEKDSDDDDEEKTLGLKISYANSEIEGIQDYIEYRKLVIQKRRTELKKLDKILNILFDY